MNKVQILPKKTQDSKDVLPELISWIRKQDDLGEDKKTVEKKIKERSNFGLNKYGMTLHTFNGRDADIDAQQELADCLQYLYQLRIERQQLSRDTFSLAQAVGLLIVEMTLEEGLF